MSGLRLFHSRLSPLADKRAVKTREANTTAAKNSLLRSRDLCDKDGASRAAVR